jgi:diguanylate cyclase (GGDEF)-like protein
MIASFASPSGGGASPPSVGDVPSVATSRECKGANDRVTGYGAVCVDDLHGGQIARSPGESDSLAKGWLVRMIERTPLADVGELPLNVFTEQAPKLIDAILDELPRAGGEADFELGSELHEQVATFASQREGADAAARIPRDLAALQAILIETLRRQGESQPGDFARDVTALAELFGAIYGALAALRGGISIAPAVTLDEDPLTGLPGSRSFDERLRVLLAEQRRYGTEFALALLDVDGLAKVNDAYGRAGGDRMLNAVAAVLRRQVREVDQVFRLEEDEFAILSPHTRADTLVPLADRVADLISRSQVHDGPRIAVATGIVDCPTDGLNAERLLESAAEATYAAKASGVTVGRSPNADRPSVLQDP